MKEGEEVADVVVILGSAVVNGKVTGDFVVVGGSAELGPKAEVDNDLVVVGGVLKADPEAKVNGKRVVLGIGSKVLNMPGCKGLEDWIGHGLFLGRPLPPQVRWSWIVAGIFLALYLLLAVLFPGPLQASIGVLETRPGSSFLTGLLAFVLFGPLILLLLFIVIGIVLVPFVICGGLAAFLFGKVAVYGYAGRRVGGNAEFLKSPVLAVIVGAIIFYLLYMIPVLGFMVWAIIAPLGVGAVLLAFFQRVRKEKPKPPAETIAAGPPPSVPGGPESATSASVLPSATTHVRAGFWLRLLATLIDVLLFIVVLKLVPHLMHPKAPAVILLWTVYHMTMWTVAGATVGGMAAGLQVIQTNGQPVTFQVALVRALAAFLSAAALMLGFFWAGWSAEKQSWHDKIAGTYVLKDRSRLAYSARK